MFLLFAFFHYDTRMCVFFMGRAEPLSKVFGNEKRLGDFAKQFTLDGRLLSDPELVSWRRVQESWSTALDRISSC